VKKKLLITMGCSFTEGMGCYDEKLQKKLNISKGEGLVLPWSSNYNKLFLDSKPSFHEHGWPVKVGKMLGYDNLINLGLSGSSTSGQVKLFMEKFSTINFSEYDCVNIIWMLTDPSRFSFYLHYINRDFHPGLGDEGISKEYLKMVDSINFDFTLEQIFYIKVMEQICKGNDIKLLITHWDGDMFDELNKMYNSNSYMKTTSSFPIDFSRYPSLRSNLCAHPNKLGYEHVATKMVDVIKKFHSNFVVGELNNNMKWKWSGDYIIFKKSTI